MKVVIERLNDTDVMVVQFLPEVMVLHAVSGSPHHMTE